MPVDAFRHSSKHNEHLGIQHLRKLRIIDSSRIVFILVLYTCSVKISLIPLGLNTQ